MRICVIIAAALCACAVLAAGADPEHHLERALSRKTAEPLWVEGTVAQALHEIEQACGSRMKPRAPGPAGDQFRTIAESLLAASGRHTIKVWFIACSVRFSALTLGAIVIVSNEWLARATEGDLWAVAAHEMAHRAGDFSRRIVIQHHLPGVSTHDKQRLEAEIEMRADQGAMLLLRSAGYDPAALRRFLDKEIRPGISTETRLRLLAFY
jgi:predicted Zn-dependent protease